MPDLFPVHAEKAASITASESDPRTIINTGGHALVYGPGTAVNESGMVDPTYADAETLEPGDKATVSNLTFFSAAIPDQGTTVIAEP